MGDFRTRKSFSIEPKPWVPTFSCNCWPGVSVGVADPVTSSNWRGLKVCLKLQLESGPAHRVVSIRRPPYCGTWKWGLRACRRGHVAPCSRLNSDISVVFAPMSDFLLLAEQRTDWGKLKNFHMSYGSRNMLASLYTPISDNCRLHALRQCYVGNVEVLTLNPHPLKCNY